MCLADSVVVDVRPDEPFCTRIASFGEQPVALLPKQFLATAKVHRANLVESNLSHTEVLGLVDETHDRMFLKRHLNRINGEIINRHLADEREKNMEADEKPITANYIELYVPAEK